MLVVWTSAIIRPNAFKRCGRPLLRLVPIDPMTVLRRPLLTFDGLRTDEPMHLRGGKQSTALRCYTDGVFTLLLGTRKKRLL